MPNNKQKTGRLCNHCKSFNQLMCVELRQSESLVLPFWKFLTCLTGFLAPDTNNHCSPSVSPSTPTNYLDYLQALHSSLNIPSKIPKRGKNHSRRHTFSDHRPRSRRKLNNRFEMALRVCSTHSGLSQNRKTVNTFPILFLQHRKQHQRFSNSESSNTRTSILQS